MKVLTPNIYVYPLKINNEEQWKQWNQRIAGERWDKFHKIHDWIGEHTREKYILKEYQVDKYTFPFYIMKRDNGGFWSKKQHPRIKTWSIICKELRHVDIELKKEMKILLEKHLDIEIKL